ncbi:hypothetical protein CRU87_08255 [Aliarcobacter trophiarum LMG 25534]|uniref:Prepilin-type cleavage/methylation domain-containing protein n=1 Tax=Aliarcobacter trophiarum LMG 25534 TaxID=1032241 RepID=A0AAD0QK66_9BACT|nr:hypothetical protein [Aliarcobacter trophiarum]AXK49013.1 hypothetical protein ATR_1150 [Aliarcobacter trophiarum LMG 25534]RXI27348.1 hypothetical protein CRU89_06470 [Aliarcobacter trophiarum]RXJ89878.1 hypothetical protein CRU87_08255 [Aliarcobacter trophiarum LMG 25534]
MQIKSLGFRKKAFSTLEIVIFIVVLATILSFFIPKFNSFLENSNLTKLKSDIALIKNGIQKDRAKRVLAQNFEYIKSLDSAQIDVENEKLFEYIFDFPSISTSTNISKNGYWAKISNNRYVFFTGKIKYEFALENGEFLCLNSKDLCEDLL